MKRASLLWVVPLVLVIGTPARAQDSAPAPVAAAEAPANGSAGRAGGSAPGRPAVAEGVSLDIKGLKGDALKKALTEALGVPVRVDGIMLHGLTLRLDNVPRDQALAEIAAAVQGSWKPMIVWTQGEEKPASLPLTPRSLSLHLQKAPCSTAASVVAAAAGAAADGHQNLTGRVTISGREVSLPTALDAIAKESGAAWSEVLSLRLPISLGWKGRAAVTKAAESTATGGHRSRGGVARPRRSRESVLAQYGAKAPTVVRVDPEIAEARASLGVFSNIFALEDRASRLQKSRKLRAAMETQNRRLEKFKPENRGLAYSVELGQLRLIMEDYQQLTEEQRKDVKPFVDYVRKRLAFVEGALSAASGKTSSTSESTTPDATTTRADAGR